MIVCITLLGLTLCYGEHILRSNQPLQLKSIKKSSDQVPKYGLFELTIDLTASYETPFDPDQVKVDVHFTSPSGKRIVVPGFFYQDFEQQIKDEAEFLIPKGEPVWKVRFAPTEVGRYRFQVIAQDKSGSVKSKTDFFEALPSKSHGYIRVSKDDKRYFEFDDGTPYFAIGLNVCWYRRGGTTDYEKWFKHLSQNGGNYARIWMPSWAFGIEWGKPFEYRMDRAWQLDYVIRLAEQKGIYIKLCIENFRRFEDDTNPYWVRNGGPCEKEIDFFINERAKEMFKKRLRYIVARWGYSTSIMAWELWNEIDCVRGYYDNKQAVIDWSKEMASYLKQIDPWKHLVVNSLGSFVLEPNLWNLAEMDFAQVHGYWHPTLVHSKELGKDMAEMISSWLSTIKGFGKPALFAEFGLVKEDWGPSPLMKEDKEGIHLHNGIWSALMTGSAGIAHIWWWGIYVEPMNLYYHFKAISEFVKGINFAKQEFKDAQVEFSSPNLRVLGLQGKQICLLWIQNKEHIWWKVAVEKKAPQPIKGATVKVLGISNGKWEAQIWDTYRGIIISKQMLKATGKSLTIQLPNVDKDIAIKLIAKR